MTQYVFGYGSLVGDAGDGHRAALLGARRGWTVAMDNTVDLPGYKHYLDARGRRPTVCVAFLDLVDLGEFDLGDLGGGVDRDDPAALATVDGVCRPVTGAVLAALDRRERQYDRVEVTGRVRGARPGRIWTYVGRPDSRARAARARRDGTLRVARAYLDAVRAAFDRLGPGERERFDASTDPPGAPVVDLRRVDPG